MHEWWKGLLDAANPKVDTPTIIGLMLVATFVALSVYSVYSKPDHSFDMAAFGLGAATLLGALIGHGIFKDRQ